MLTGSVCSPILRPKCWTCFPGGWSGCSGVHLPRVSLYGRSRTVRDLKLDVAVLRLHPDIDGPWCFKIEFSWKKRSAPLILKSSQRVVLCHPNFRNKTRQVILVHVEPATLLHFCHLLDHFELRHPNITKCIEMLHSNSRLFLVMEFAGSASGENCSRKVRYSDTGHIRRYQYFGVRTLCIYMARNPKSLVDGVGWSWHTHTHIVKLAPALSEWHTKWKLKYSNHRCYCVVDVELILIF